MVYYSAIKKEQTIDICYYMGEPQIGLVKEDKNILILYHSIHIKCQDMQANQKWQKISGCLSNRGYWGEGGRDDQGA